MWADATSSLLEIRFEELGTVKVVQVPQSAWQERLIKERKKEGRRWMENLPADLRELDLVNALRDQGLFVGDPRPYGQGMKYRTSCFLWIEHSNQIDDDSGCLFVEPGKLSHWLCSNHSHQHLDQRDLFEWVGLKEKGKEDQGKAANGLPCLHGGVAKFTADGLVFFPTEETKPPLRLCGPVHFLASIRNTDSNQWGLLLEWKDQDGIAHHQTVTHKMLAGDGTAYRGGLADGGLYVTADQRGRYLLTEILTQVKPHDRVRVADRLGWHGSMFLFPEEGIGPTKGERVVFISERTVSHNFSVKGALEQWNRDIGTLCVGNPRMVFGVSCAFAGPLMHDQGMESGGYNLKGHSSTGKSTILDVSGSPWGGSDAPSGYRRSWRVTDNGMEGAAAAHSDGFMTIDEMGEVDPVTLSATAYMLANGISKTRARQDGTSRPPLSWRLIFLSTGEVGLGEKLDEIGRKPKAGQEVRLVDIPAEEEGGFGVFRNLHGFASGQAFADHLKAAARETYGSPIRRFLAALTAKPDRYCEEVKQSMAAWVQSLGLKGVDGQILRVANRFALVAAAGELAVKLGVIQWPLGEAGKGVRACFDAWLAERPGRGPAELVKGVRQVLEFIHTHGSSRCEPAWDAYPDSRISNRIGFRKMVTDRWEYYILPSAFANEACKGFNARLVAKELVRRGILEVDGEGKSSRPVDIKNNGTKRVYVFRNLPDLDDLE